MDFQFPRKPVELYRPPAIIQPCLKLNIEAVDAHDLPDATNR